jgi:cytoskeleton protein RodZ
MSSFGQEIRRERELRQISLREVAEATKISLRYLEALENNEFEQLPGGVFNRGFVRAYAEFIGVDTETMVNSYLLEERGQGSPEDRPSEDDAVFRSGNRQASAKSARGPGTPVFKWGLIALVAAVVIVAVILVYLRLSGPAIGDTGQIATEPNPPLKQTVLPASRPEPETTRAIDRPHDESPAQPAILEPAVEATHQPAPETRDETDAKVDAVIHVDRPTSGRLNCDNRRIEMLDGMPAGTVLELSCASYLIVDAADAGALRLALSGREAERLGDVGQRLSGYRIEADASVGQGRQP